MQPSVYDACTKVGRRWSVLSADLLKHWCSEDPVKCPQISHGETIFRAQQKEGDPVHSLASRAVQM